MNIIPVSLKLSFAEISKLSIASYPKNLLTFFWVMPVSVAIVSIEEKPFEFMYVLKVDNSKLSLFAQLGQTSP